MRCPKMTDISGRVETLNPSVLKNRPAMHSSSQQGHSFFEPFGDRIISSSSGFLAEAGKYERMRAMISEGRSSIEAMMKLQICEKGVSGHHLSRGRRKSGLQFVIRLTLCRRESYKWKCRRGKVLELSRVSRRGAGCFDLCRIDF
jgi:hypothetical protein